MRSFKDSVAAWCLEFKVHPGDSGDIGTARLERMPEIHDSNAILTRKSPERPVCRTMAGL
jgi:hypothetical protein